MTVLKRNTILSIFLKSFPLLMLYYSVLNDFDANYFEIQYLSFNFAYILIFFWTLKKIDFFGYGLIFFAGIINDSVNGLPLGLSSFLYMIICVATSYFRSITLRPTLIKDWAFFLLTISIVNSVYYIILSIIFTNEIDYKFLLVNNFTTFLLYFFFHIIFNYFYERFFGKVDV